MTSNNFICNHCRYNRTKKGELSSEMSRISKNYILIVEDINAWDAI